MTIHSLQEFRNRADEYFVKYVKNELRERIYAFYKEYERQKTQRVDLRFKDFFISNIKNFFALETRHLSSEK